MTERRCEREVEGPDEAPRQICGRPATRYVRSRWHGYGQGEWCACDEHAREAERDGAELEVEE